MYAPIVAILGVILPAISAAADYDSIYPRVVVCLLARNKAEILPYFLGQFEELDYPKDRISLFVRSDHNQDYTSDILVKWVSKARNFYSDIDSTFDDSEDHYADEEDIFDWSERRYKHVMSLKEEALVQARRSHADYVFFLDCDALLFNTRTLQRLIAANKTVIAPMLRDVGSNYSNFWAATDANGYYRRTDEYLQMVSGERRGVFAVPMVHSAVLVQLRAPAADALTFAPTGYGGPVDDLFAFAHSAAEARVDMFVANDADFGVVVPPTSPGQSLDVDVASAQYVLLELLQWRAPPPALRTPLLPPAPPPADTLGFDRVYVINLRRRADRRRRMDASFRILGINATYWPAVDGRELDAPTLERMGVRMLPGYEDPIQKRPLTSGEVGCFLSHHAVWKDVVANGYSKVVVFEDDVRFGAQFRQLLGAVMEDVERNHLEWDLTYLGRKRMGDDAPLLAGHRFLAKATYSYWTLAYVLSASGARKLLDAEPLGKLVALDEFLPIMYDEQPTAAWKAHFPRRHLRAFTTEPLLVEPTRYTNQPGYVTDTEESWLMPTTTAADTRAKEEL